MPRVHDFESGPVQYPMLWVGWVAIPKCNTRHDNACAPGRACRECLPILQIALLSLVEIYHVKRAGQESAGPVEAAAVAASAVGIVEPFRLVSAVGRDAIRLKESPVILDNG